MNATDTSSFDGSREEIAVVDVHLKKAAPAIWWLAEYGVPPEKLVSITARCPQFLIRGPDRLKSDFLEVAKFLESCGITKEQWAAVLADNPSYFALPAGTLKANFTFLMAVAEMRMFGLREKKGIITKKARATWVLKQRWFLGWSEDNILLRFAYAEITETGPKMEVLKLSRGEIERNLIKHLGFNPDDIVLPKFVESASTKKAEDLKAAFKACADEIRENGRRQLSGEQLKRVPSIKAIVAPEQKGLKLSQEDALILYHLIRGGLIKRSYTLG